MIKSEKEISFGKLLDTMDEKLELDPGKNSFGIPRSSIWFPFCGDLRSVDVYQGTEIWKLLQYVEEEVLYDYEDTWIVFYEPGTPYAEGMVHVNIKPQTWSTDAQFDYFTGWRGKERYDTEGSLCIRMTERESGRNYDGALVTERSHAAMVNYELNYEEAHPFFHRRGILIVKAISEEIITKSFAWLAKLDQKDRAKIMVEWELCTC